MTKAKDKIIIALDGMDIRAALALATRLSELCWGFKVNDLLMDQGVRVIEQLKAFGQVFADPKLHDIPNTVANSVKRLESAGADLITVHASGGKAMLEAAQAATIQAKILAVTALTSLNDQDTNLIYQRSTDDTVEALAQLAMQAKLPGIVCSPQELSLLKEFPLIKITPGVRPQGSSKDDQQRTMTPLQALKAGATMLVIGRPITQAADPIHALNNLINSLEN